MEIIQELQSNIQISDGKGSFEEATVITLSEPNTLQYGEFLKLKDIYGKGLRNLVSMSNDIKENNSQDESESDPLQLLQIAGVYQESYDEFLKYLKKFGKFNGEYPIKDYLIKININDILSLMKAFYRENLQ